MGDSSLFAICSVVLLLWSPTYIVVSLLSANGSQVKASIEEMFVPGVMFNSASSSFVNCTSIFFVLSFYDDTYDMGVEYDNLTLTFNYLGNNTSSTNIPLGNYTWPGFFQESNEKGSTVKFSEYIVTQGFVWDAEASKSASEVVFRVNLATGIRFKYAWWKSNTHELLVQGDVKLSTSTGKKVAGEAVKLRSYSGHDSGDHYKGIIVAYVFLCVIAAVGWMISIPMACS